MGETDRPESFLKSDQELEYETKKLPYVKQQYGLYDKCSGVITHCKSRQHAHDIAALEPDRWIPMKRSVSEWLEDKW